MIDLYTWGTPNGRKISIMLEETGLEYTPHSINIGDGEQNTESFSKISPNNKIPAIVDHDTGITLMESGAILIYLAEKSGKFLPSGGKERLVTLEWLMWQMGGIGPMLGQVHHFVKFNKGSSEYAEKRYLLEGLRLYKVMDQRLSDNEYLNGKTYSIADIATWPWIARYDWQTIDLSGFGNVLRWYKDIAQRPQVKIGWNIPRTEQKIPLPM